jgi:hypothetical protein
VLAYRCLKYISCIDSPTMRVLRISLIPVGYQSYLPHHSTLLAVMISGPLYLLLHNHTSTINLTSPAKPIFSFLNPIFIFKLASKCAAI